MMSTAPEQLYFAPGLYPISIDYPNDGKLTSSWGGEPTKLTGSLSPKFCVRKKFYFSLDKIVKLF